MASTSTKDTAAPAGGLTQRDFTLLLAAFECNKNDFVVDYAKFAEKTGLANANSAKASWHGLKKKLDKAAGVDASKGKASVASGGASKDDGEAAEETGKKAKAKGKKAKAETEDAGEGEAVKPAKGRKRKTATPEEAEEAKPKAKKGRKGKNAAAAEFVEESVEADDGVKSEPEE